MKEWFYEKKEEMEELNFGIVDFIMAILTGLSFFVSLWFMRFSYRTFHTGVMGSLLLGMGLEVVFITIAVFVMEKKHKDDVYDDEDDDWVYEDDEYYYYE